MNEKVNASITSTQEKNGTVNKTGKSQEKQNQLLPPKVRKMAQFTRKINQGLFQ